MHNEELDKLKLIAQKIQDFLEEDYDESPNALVDRLGTINTYLAISGKSLADAKLIQDKEISAMYSAYNNLILKMPATIATKFINSQTYEINYLVNWLDRINRALVHTGDNTRTQISFAKEELRLTKQGY